MSTGKSLVDEVAAIIKSDTSIARRFIVEGCVTVAGDVISDPAFRLSDSQTHKIRIETSAFVKRLLDKIPTTTKESA